MSLAQIFFLLAAMAGAALHCLVRALRWFRVSDAYAIGVYGPVMETSPDLFKDPKSECCEELFRDSSRDVERDLKSHTGMVSRLFLPFYYRAQLILIIIAFACTWLSGLTLWLLLLPITAWIGSWGYFHIQGSKWLQAGCERYLTKGASRAEHGAAACTEDRLVSEGPLKDAHPGESLPDDTDTTKESDPGRIYTEAELHLVPFCVGPREAVTYTEAEVEHWLHLRAIEWFAWPAFITQPLIPILLRSFPVLSVLLVLVLADLSWRFVNTSWINMTLIRIGPIITLLRWPCAIVCACLLAFSHRFGIAALALVWPLVGGFVSVLGGFLSARLGFGGIGDVERALATRIGYPNRSEDAHDSGPLGNSGPPPVRPLRIVSLDDEPFVGDALKMMIGFDFPDSIVLTYTDAELALQELERRDPDLFITDWNHRGRLHGGKLLQVLADKGVTYPILVITAYAESIAFGNGKGLDQFTDQGLNVKLQSKPFLLGDLRPHLSACRDNECASQHGREKSSQSLNSTANSQPITGSNNETNGIDSVTPRKVNYFMRHWRGDLSLGVSYWLNGFLGYLLVAILAAFASAFNETSGLKTIAAIVIFVYFLSLLASVWQIVGVWRSASKHVGRGGKPVWAALAKVAIFFGVLNLAQFTGKTTVPQSMELASIVLGDTRIPPYKITVLPGGEEVEFQGGIRAGSAEELERILNAVPQAKMLRINSVGGRIGEAERMAKLVRERGMDTFTSEECLSAATDVFIAGKERRVAAGAKVGFHQGWIAGMTDYQRRSVDESNRQAMRAVGISDEFINRALATPPEDMWYASFDEMLNAGVITSKPLDFSEEDFIPHKRPALDLQPVEQHPDSLKQTGSFSYEEAIESPPASGVKPWELYAKKKPREMFEPEQPKAKTKRGTQDRGNVGEQTARRGMSVRTVATGNGGHWIESVLDDGKLIKLEDGTLWRVSPLDTLDSGLWLPVSGITVIDGDDVEYPYKLVNTDDNGVVNAQPIVTAVAKEDHLPQISPTRSITSSPVESVAIVKVLADDYKAIIQRKNGDQYLIQYGIGVLSIWRYEGRSAVVESPGLFLGVGSKLILPESDQTARIWNAARIGD